MTDLIERTWRIWVPIAFVAFLALAMVGGTNIMHAIQTGSATLAMGIFFVMAGFAILFLVLIWLIPRAARDVEEREAKVDALLVSYGVDPARASKLREQLQTDMMGLVRR